MALQLNLILYQEACRVSLSWSSTPLECRKVFFLHYPTTVRPGNSLRQIAQGEVTCCVFHGKQGLNDDTNVDRLFAGKKQEFSFLT